MMTPEEVAESLFKAAECDRALRAKTDAEIAELVVEHLWAQVDMFSATDCLLEQVVDRLRRAGGGGLEDEPATPPSAPPADQDGDQPPPAGRP